MTDGETVTHYYQFDEILDVETPERTYKIGKLPIINPFLATRAAQSKGCEV